MRTSQTLTALAACVGLVVGSAGCPETPVAGEGEGEGEASAGEGEGEGGDEGEGEVLPPPPFAISTKNRVAWKRHRAFESDLLAGLALEKQELCNELGLYSCIDFVHTVPLGGNEPFAKSQYEPLPSPTVTTPIAVDRVALSGCTARVDKDAAGPAVVFVGLDLAAGSVDEEDAAAAVDALGPRLLSRRLTPDEVAAFADLRVDDDGADVSARDFAIVSCFAVATLSENLFY